MEEVKPTIIKDEMSVGNLKVTKPISGQEWCAFVYLLVKEPKDGLYGVVKMICTGSSMAEVENRVIEMIDKGEIEKDLPTICIQKTGYYRYLAAGGDPNAQKEAYNVNTKEKIIEPRKIAAERRKEQIAETNRQMEELREESEKGRDQNPDSYENYKFYKVQVGMIDPYIKKAEMELEELKKTKAKSIKEVQRVERQFGNYRLKFEKEISEK